MIVAPEHMDRWSRHERLYRHLLGLGLVVDPVFEDEANTRIAYLCVSVDLAAGAAAGDHCSNLGAAGDIGAPMKRPEIIDGVSAPDSIGDNVVHFPSVG